MTSNWCSDFKRKATEANINYISIHITLQMVVPIYKGFVNLKINSFKTQVAILSCTMNVGVCLLQFLGNKDILMIGNSYS